MTEIYCGSDNCLYNKNCKCTKYSVNMDDEGCEDYEDYTETEEYQKPYYKQVLIKVEDELSENTYKLLDKGKRIEYKGYVFYYNADDRNSMHGIQLTEERTGYSMPYRVLDDEKMFSEMKERLPGIQDVAGLSEVYLNCGKWYFKDETKIEDKTEFIIKTK